MTYDGTAPVDGEVRQNGASRRFDVMHGQTVHNGQTVFVDIEPLSSMIRTVFMMQLPALPVHNGQTQSTGEMI